MIVKLNFHVNLSKQFSIFEYMIPSFEGSVNMDIYEDVDVDDYLRKEVRLILLIDWGNLMFKHSNLQSCVQVLNNQTL